MLSRTLRLAQRFVSWWMIEMPRSTASLVEASRTGSPSSTSSPPEGCSTPERIFISVDLPAPFSPNRTVTLPRRTSKLTCLSARVTP
jgi:hypothetical protein